MSDLNEKIAVWRASIEPRLGHQAADELEDHLRSTIESLKPTGLADEERLLVASHRLGSTAQLSQEFTKNDTAAVWRQRAVWMLLGFAPLRFLVTGFEDAAGQPADAFLMLGLPIWGAALISMIVPSFIMLGVLAIGLKLSVLRGRWQSPSVAWLHTSPAMRVASFVVIFLALHFASRGVSLLFYGGRRFPLDHAGNFNEFIVHNAMVLRLLSLIFSMPPAVALAWMIAAPRADRDPASTDLA